MVHDAEPTPPAEGDSVLDGTLGRVVFQRDDRTFMVARFVATDGTSTTVLGDLIGLTEGADVRLRGTWVADKKWGRQFRVTSYAQRSPETLDGIEKVLGSGMIPGIGPAFARRIVAAFGLETLAVLELAPERIREVDGIGAARAARIAEAFRHQREMRDIMVFLRGHGVSAAFASRIVRRYGKDAVARVRDNPYRLATEVWGIGFRTADTIAEKLGFAKDAPARVEAGLVHALGEFLDEGHLHAPKERLIQRARELLGLDGDPWLEALERLHGAGLVVRESLGDRGECWAMAAAHANEVEAAHALGALIRTPGRALGLDVDAAVQAFETTTGMALATAQRRAVTTALLDKCVVITGGPGVGKTTIVRAIVELASRAGLRLALAAPTGRAAQRLADATRREAMTLHRLLEVNPQTRTFARGRDLPLDAELVIVDEASMIDIALFGALVIALRPTAQLVLVGDIDQLPSVGPGAVLHDVIASDVVPVVRLTEIFRQAAESQIVIAAHAINRGEVPDLTGRDAGRDFYFIEREDPIAARDTIIELVATRIPQRFGLRPDRDIQVLTPMHRGDLGTTALNQALQARLNPGTDGHSLSRGDRRFRVRDKVMQVRNDYDKGVFNGDIGLVESIDPEAGNLRVDYDGRMVDYEQSELEQLLHAYAVSVHKSQGSEYPAVVLPVSTQHFLMLQRSLLYTAVTRGKQLVTLVGSKRAIGLAVRNRAASARMTWLAERLRCFPGT